MLKNIIAAILLIVSVTLHFKHAWETAHYQTNPASLRMMADLGIVQELIPFLVGIAITIGVLLLIPNTFFLGNMLNAVTIVVIIGFSLRAGNYRMALIEIPFLAMPLIMIWLKYPFKKN
ncbi:hypothetical protein [Pedobacter sp. SYP-B3415]|uniref:hypothetical protein n=1 Tax=Pedobacter sp. SYP-B3415 TaxID=2496641 RepID=UPI00101DC6B6|nr:hypothetical protein [Pedobacter sp. SYP-B3415]